MALATEDEWERDPELKAMRAEFVASFAEREAALRGLIERLRSDGSPEAIDGAARIAHKLAGAAGTYGFPALTRAAAAIEDRFNLSPSGSLTAERALRYSGLLAEMLAAARARGKEDPSFEADERFVELTSG